jgi:NAD(P)-dependent dehydrogenase (short-subunit alcohol dehydrogenase family)
MSPEPRLAGRLALVTGATRGIGRAVALAYAKEGAHLILVGRTSGALEEVDDEIRIEGASATLLTLDLRTHDKIDSLGLSPLGHVTAEAWNEVLDVNLTANWRLIRTLDPLLRRSDAGRAIFVSSGAATSARAYWGPYAVSKAGLEALVKVYAHEIESTPVRVNLVNPGPTRTAMRAKAFPGESPSSLKPPDHVAETFVKLAAPACTDNGRLYDLRTGEVR